jgi:hypothetical protein
MRLIRTQRIKVKPETRRKCKKYIGLETGEVDKYVLQQCENGKVSKKITLYQTDPYNVTLISNTDILDGEPIGAYIGTLRERTTFDVRVGNVDSIAHLWYQQHI